MPTSAPLRPRDALRLLDAAFEAVASAPEAAWPAILGGVPVALAALWLAYDASAHAAGWPALVRLAALTAGAGLLRYVAGGAAVRLVLTGVEGERISPGRAFAEAARRAPSLIAAGAMGAWAVAVSAVAGFLPLLAWGGVFLSVPLVLTREAAPWRSIRGARALLGLNTGRSLGLTLLWLLGIVLLSLNLAGLSMLALYLGAHLLDLDVVYLRSVLSPGNPIFLPATTAVAFVLLEPVRWASLALLLVDGRVRRDALDLEAAAAALPPVARRRRRGTAALVLCLVLGGATAARAQVPPGAAASPRARLLADARWAAAQGAPVDPEAIARALRGAQGDDPALAALASEVEADLGAGRVAAAGRRLSLALAALPQARAPAARTDPRVLARRILAEPAFQEVQVHPAGKADLDSGPFDRFFRWLGRLLKKLFSHAPQAPAKAPTPTHGLGWVMWALILGGALVVVALGVTRALGGRRPPEGVDASDDAPTDRPPPRPGTALADALARAPDAWLAEADAAARDGAHREAVRLGYLALLSALHRAQAIDYARARTNWDLVRGFRGEGLALETFEDVTRRYEHAWYGLGAVTGDGYQLVRASALQVVHAVGGLGLG